MSLPLEPTTQAQRLEHALGPEHLRLRFRTYHEYPTEEQARWCIIELVEVGFRPRRIATLLAIAPHVVDYWRQRFRAFGLLGLTTRTREATPSTTRVSLQKDVSEVLVCYSLGVYETQSNPQATRVIA